MHNQHCCNRERTVNCERSCECRHVERVVCRRIREKECRPVCRRTVETRGPWQNCGKVGFEDLGECSDSGHGHDEGCCSRD